MDSAGSRNMLKNYVFPIDPNFSKVKTPNKIE